MEGSLFSFLERGINWIEAFILQMGKGVGLGWQLSVSYLLAPLNSPHPPVGIQKGYVEARCLQISSHAGGGRSLCPVNAPLLENQK